MHSDNLTLDRHIIVGVNDLHEEVGRSRGTSRNRLGYISRTQGEGLEIVEALSSLLFGV